MAALTHTVTSHDPIGETTVVTGSITVGDANKNHMALLPTTGYVHACSVQSTTELTTDPLVVINQNTAEATTNGSVLIETSAACSLHYTAIVAGGPF